MFFLRTAWSEPAQVEWRASANLRADAEAVLTALTDPEEIAAWAPVNFEVEGLAGDRLEAGSRERVTGSLAGIGVAFDVEVACANLERLELTAQGPVGLEVSYRFLEHGEGVLVEATVRIIGRGGVMAQVLHGAVAAVLSAGALDSALRRLGASLDRVESGLVAA
ncbi:MAG TPA: SRPBCC family protein [Solirubrobacteraceae bacterium]|nr:SRPBCC family protein [Solirubrobacteraceae bacterium]